MMELCDQIYLSPEASMGVTPGGNVAEHWQLVMLGGIEVYVKTPNADDVEDLRKKMVEAKKRLSKSHPDGGGTAERFRVDYDEYQAALKEYEVASEKLLTRK
jgi:hypothetical protein